MKRSRISLDYIENESGPGRYRVVSSNGSVKTSERPRQFLNYLVDTILDNWETTDYRLEISKRAREAMGPNNYDFLHNYKKLANKIVKEKRNSK